MKEYDSYFTIEQRMTRDLHLKGNKLLIYAVISKFSDKGQGVYHGSRGYLSSLTGCTLKSVDNALKELLNDGLIVKGVMNKKGTNEMFITYQTTYKNVEIAKDIKFLKSYLLNDLTSVDRELWFRHYRLEQDGVFLTMYVERKECLSEYIRTSIQRQIDFFNLQQGTNYNLTIVVDEKKSKEV